MIQRVHVAVVAAAVGCVTTLLLVFILRWCYHRRRRNFVEPSSLQQAESTRLHHHHNRQQNNNNNTIHHPFDQGSKTRSNNYFVFHRGISETPLFSWGDHPSLAADAVENGWSRFAFTAYKTHISSSPSKRSALLGVCASGDHNHNHNNSIHGVRESESEIISWEVCQGSADFMQKIRLNPGLIKRPIHPNNTTVASLIRTALPLPGPPLGNFSFPQEAYFEITILFSRGDHDYESVSKSREGEKTKLIQDGLTTKAKSEALIHHVTSSHHKINNIQDIKLDAKTGESVAFSLGLTAAASVPLRVPGSYPGSIGFNSNGSVFLDGMKLVFESDKAEWVGSEKVVGCGFDPRQKKVFFTLDSELVHVIHCQSEEFGTPLYPTLAANIDILVLINFGQSAFKYAPANAQRTPNPCFVAPLVNSPVNTLGYDDSRELFSMGRIDSQWLNRSATKGSYNNNGTNNNRVVDFDEESEADLFEIVLDGCGKPPNSAS